MIDGEIAGAVNRIPPEGQARSNLHVGGKAEKKILNNRELEICEALSEELKKKELILVGLDIIGNYLTEINVTCPTGVRQIKKLGGPDIPNLFWNQVEDFF